MTSSLVLDQLKERWVAVLLTSATIYLVVSYVRAYLRLRSFSGPRLASFSYYWMASNISRSGRHGVALHEAMTAHRSAKSHFVRIGPNDLVTDSPEVVRHMAGSRPPYARSSWYRAVKLDPYGDSLLSTTSTAYHDRLKAQVARGYAGRDNDNLEKTLDDGMQALIDFLRSKYISDDSIGVYRPVEMARTILHFTLDMATKAAFGEAFGFLDADSDLYNWEARLMSTLPGIVLGAEVPQLGDVFLSSWFLSLFGPKTTDKDGLGFIMGLTRKLVAERFKPNAKDSRDMLGSFVRHGLTQRQCEEEAMLQIVAASDTTAAAMRGTLLRLASTPTAYAKLQREIDDAVRSGLVGDGMISNAAAKKLPYLQAVVYEGIRVNPPFTGLVMKQVPAGGDTIDGEFVPAGVRIGTDITGMQLRRDIYGQDAEVFRPERWINCNDETRQRMMSTTELVFGCGKWMCAGRNVAMMELNKIYFELLRRFNFQVVNNKIPVKTLNYNIVFEWDMMMKVTERRVSEN